MITARSLSRLAALTALCFAAAIAPAGAQQSTSYRMNESTIDSGGDPGSAGSLVSAHFHVSLDAVGANLALAGSGSVSFHVDGGFVASFRPPGEVSGLRFSDQVTLQWNPERSAARYELYRGAIASLPGTFGACFAGDLAAETITDASIPPVGGGSFYLVTARNSLREEGPKGFRSDGTEEANPLPCP